MGLASRAKQLVRRALGARSASLQTQSERLEFFRSEDIGWICDTYFNNGSVPGRSWDALRDAHMELPSWFRQGLDPFGEAYVEQQHRLWQLISGVDRRYEPDVDEKEHSWGDIDPVRTPGYFVRRDQIGRAHV